MKPRLTRALYIYNRMCHAPRTNRLGVRGTPIDHNVSCVRIITSALCMCNYRVWQVKPFHRLGEVVRRSSWAIELMALCLNNKNNENELPMAKGSLFNHFTEPTENTHRFYWRQFGFVNVPSQTRSSGRRKIKVYFSFESFEGQNLVELAKHFLVWHVAEA